MSARVVRGGSVMAEGDDVRMTAARDRPASWRSWPLRDYRRPALIAGLVAGLLIAGVVGCAMLVKQRMWAHSTAAGWAQLEHETRHAADYVERQMRRVDALHGLARVAAEAIDLGHGRSASSAFEEIKRNLGGRGEIVQVAVLDAFGNLMWSSLGATDEGINLADREHYRAIAVGGADSFTGSPVVGRRSGVLMVPFSRAVRRGGTLMGITVVSVDAAVIAGVALGEQHAGDSRADVWRVDGLLLGGKGSAVSTLPQFVPGAELLAKAMDGGTVSRLVETVPDRPLAVAVRQVGQSDVVVALTRGARELLAPEAGELNAFNAWLAASIAGVIVLCGAGMQAAVFRARTRRDQERRREAGLLTEIAINQSELVAIFEVTAARQVYFDYVSPGTETMIGHAPEALRLNPRLLRIHPDDLAGNKDRLRRLVAGETLKPAEYRLVCADESVIWIEASTQRIPGDPARPGVQRFLMVMRDITARVTARAALARTTARMADLLQVMTGWVSEVEVAIEGAAFRVISEDHSDGITRVTGLTREEVRTQDVCHRIGGDGAAAARARMMQVALREGRASFVLAGKHVDGREIHLHCSYSVVARSATRATLVGFVFDITEETNLREEVAQVTRLAALGEMAAAISHELHQPLSAIALHAETLALKIGTAAPGNETMLRHTDKIVDLTQRAASVMKHVRSFGRRETGPGTLFNLRDAIDHALQITDGRIQQSGLAVRCHTPEQPVMLRGHAMSVEQVVVNLLSNALDAYAELPALPPDPRGTSR